MHPSDDIIRDILKATKSIAVVGASANPARPSHGVMRWLLGRRYRVIAINPGLGTMLLGAPVFARLSDVDEQIDLVDIFRASNVVGPVVDEALALPVRPKVIWMQLGVADPVAAARAEAAGLTVVMDRCPMIEAARLVA